ncbi:hypothetical protein BDB00DRAFT_767850, partial [Zychaea mexicana]|uniref:uncharacterized protein n=1 Tax=Zychaea mexicana TaxID=64656 RepID=UPI0022FE0E17
MHFDILALQDTKFPSEDAEQRITNQFQANQCYWSTFCGLVSFSPQILLTPLFSSRDGRALWVTISHVNSSFEPFHVLNIYAPAERHSRHTFFHNLLAIFNLDSFSLPLQRCVLVGNFNYSYSRSDSSYLSAPNEWISFLSSTFFNLMQPPNDNISPPITFKSQSGHSCIDYIFSSPDLYPIFSLPTIEFIDYQWSDHAIVCSNMRLTISSGKGVWRANPLLCRSETFKQTLYHDLESLCESFSPTLSPQEQWDQVKYQVKLTCQKLGRKQASRRRQEIKQLQRQRNNLLSRPDGAHRNASQVLSIEAEITRLQQEAMDILALRASSNW